MRNITYFPNKDGGCMTLTIPYYAPTGPADLVRFLEGHAFYSFIPLHRCNVRSWRLRCRMQIDKIIIHFGSLAAFTQNAKRYYPAKV